MYVSYLVKMENECFYENSVIMRVNNSNISLSLIENGE